MKIEHLIVQHLYNASKVSLEDIGTFYLAPGVVIDHDNKEAVLPENAITFEYNPRAIRDESLVEFIVQHSRKIRPLATSDLESYSILGREYLNIGKPFYIEGLGTLYKSQQGKYEFMQGSSVNPRLEAKTEVLKEKQDAAINFSQPRRNKRSVAPGLILLGVIVAALTCAAFLYFFNKKKNVPVPVATVQDTPAVQRPVTNTVNPTDTTKIDSSALKTSVDSASFTVAIKTYRTKEAAYNALAKLASYGHKVQVVPVDSAYVITMPFMVPLSDTSKVKDSLSLFFGVKAYILRKS